MCRVNHCRARMHRRPSTVARKHPTVGEVRRDEANGNPEDMQGNDAFVLL